MSVVLSVLSALFVFYVSGLLLIRWEQSRWSKKHGLKERKIPWPLSLWVRRQKREAIRRELPFFMDLLAVAVSAGLDWILVLERMAAFLPGTALTREIVRMITDLKLGKGRREALVDLKRRVGLSEVDQFCGILIQTLQLGSPVSPVLEANAWALRQRRFHRAERLGSQAALKILVPLVFCILPAVFLLIFAPLGLRLVTEGVGGLL